MSIGGTISVSGIGANPGMENWLVNYGSTGLLYFDTQYDVYGSTQLSNDGSYWTNGNAYTLSFNVTVSVLWVGDGSGLEAINTLQILHSVNVYLGIYTILKDRNDNFKMWATGSRVKGNWRTKEESDEMVIKYGLKHVKYSDYDFHTDAKNLPNIQDISDMLKVKVDLCGFEGDNLVEIIP